MIRLLLRLFRIYDFEVCKSCETLKGQLIYERDEKQRYVQALLDIIKPKVVESAPIELNQISQSSALFSRRRKALEEKDRIEAAVLSQSKNIGRPDFASIDSNIDKLESELGIEKEGA